MTVTLKSGITLSIVDDIRRNQGRSRNRQLIVVCHPDGPIICRKQLPKEPIARQERILAFTASWAQVDVRYTVVDIVSRCDTVLL